GREPSKEIVDCVSRLKIIQQRLNGDACAGEHWRSPHYFRCTAYDGQAHAHTLPPPAAPDKIGRSNGEVEWPDDASALKSSEALQAPPRRPSGRRGRTISSGARGAKPQAHHGPLERLLEGLPPPPNKATQVTWHCLT